MSATKPNTRFTRRIFSPSSQSPSLALAARALNTVSPLATLDRGFAIVTRAADGALVTDASSVNVGDEIDARVARGKVRARVTGTEKKD